MNEEQRPLDWRFVGWWALSIALGFGITAIGQLPNLLLIDFSDMDRAEYAQLWTVLGLGFVWAAAGGLVAGAIQARILAAHGEPAARRWLLHTVIGWMLGWSICLAVPFSIKFGNPIVYYQASSFGRTQALVFYGVWLGVTMGWLQQRSLRYKAPLHTEWQRWSWVAWIAGGATYLGIRRLGEWHTLPARIAEGLLAGAVIGLIAGLGLQWLLQRSPLELVRFPRKWIFRGLMSLALLSFWLVPSGICYRWGCSDPWLDSPPAPWSTQLAVAQSGAHGVDPQAVPMVIQAWPPEHKSLTGDVKTIQVIFDYAGSSTDISTGFLDNAPVETAGTESHPGGNFSLSSSQEHEQMRQTLAAIKISPTDAYRETASDAKTMAQRYGEVYIDIGMSLRPTAPAGTPQPPVWNITYSTLSHPLKFLSIDVDARTGEILKRVEMFP